MGMTSSGIMVDAEALRQQAEKDKLVQTIKELMGKSSSDENTALVEQIDEFYKEEDFGALIVNELVNKKQFDKEEYWSMIDQYGVLTADAIRKEQVAIEARNKANYQKKLIDEYLETHPK